MRAWAAWPRAPCVAADSPPRDAARRATFSEEALIMNRMRRGLGWLCLLIAALACVSGGWLGRSRPAAPVAHLTPTPTPWPAVIEQPFLGGYPKTMSAPVTVLDYEGYTSGFSAETRTPLWVCFHLFRTDTDAPDRPNQPFTPDPRMPVLVTHADYTGGGYDRGHMAPSAAIGKCYGADGQLETYHTTNICPQHPGLNQRCWERFEYKVLHDYVESMGDVWEIDGPIFEAPRMELLSGVHVPTAFYAIVAARLDGRYEALALVMPNERTDRSTVRQYVTTVRAIETRTGIDFFSALPVSIDEPMETEPPSDPRWHIDDKLEPIFAGASRTIHVRPCQ